MTCIVGYVDKDNGNVLIAADSAGVSGTDITIRKDPKAFKNGEFVIGCTSSFRMIQLLRFSFNPPDVGATDIYEYMCTTFIDEVRKCFDKGGYLQKYKDGDEKGGEFLAAYKNRLFKVGSDFQVSETVRGFDACGCGEDYALGSIYSSLGKAPNGVVLDALSCAAYFSGGVSAPFIILST